MVYIFFKLSINLFIQLHSASLSLVYNKSNFSSDILLIFVHQINKSFFRYEFWHVKPIGRHFSHQYTYHHQLLCLQISINTQLSSTKTSILSLYVCIYPSSLLRAGCDTRVGRMFTNGPGDLGSLPGYFIPKTLKMVLDTTLLNTQQYKVCIKDKVEQSRKRSSVLPYTLV